MKAQPRWLAALLIAALIFSGLPMNAWAAPAARDDTAATPAVRAGAAAQFLLVVAPPQVAVAAGTPPATAAGLVQVAHARRFVEVQGRLEALAARGLIAGFAAQPQAYAFAVEGPTAEAQATLRTLGDLRPLDNPVGMAAAAVEDLQSTYARQLQAAIASANRPVPAAAGIDAAQAPASVPPATQTQAAHPAAALLGTAGAGGPEFEIYLYSPSVYARVDAGVRVTITLKSAAGVVKGTAVEIGTGQQTAFMLRDGYWNPVPVAPTDVLEVQMPALITIPVVTLSAAIDGASRRATGTAPANVTNTDSQLLPFLEFSLGQSKFITTTPSGTFAVATEDASPGRSWVLRFANAERQYTTRQGVMPVLTLRGAYADYYEGGYVADDFVSGAVLTPTALLTVTLARTGSPPIVNYTRAEADGTFALFLRDVYRNPVEIRAGDSVQVTGGGVTLVATAPAFDIMSRADQDVITGITDAVVTTDTVTMTQTLAVWPASLQDDAYGNTTLPNGGVINVANPFCLRADRALNCETINWNPGDWGHLRYRTADGNIVYAAFSAPGHQPLVFLRGRYAYTQDNHVFVVQGLEGRGSLTLLDAANNVKTRLFVDAQSEFVAELRDPYGNPLPILAGDTVVASFQGYTTTVTAPLLTMAGDFTNDTVRGQITPGLVTTTTSDLTQTLAIYVLGSNTPVMVQPDPGNGTFTADFSGIVDIQPGGEGYARYVDTNGAIVHAQWTAALRKPALALRGYEGYRDDDFVRVDLGTFVCDSRKLDLRVTAADNSVRWQQALPVCGAAVEVHLEDPFGHELPLNPGDTVFATFDGQTTTARVPQFQVVSDPRALAVYGVTDAPVTTTTVGLPQTLAVWPQAQSDSDFGKHTLLANGTFSVTNPFYSAADASQTAEELVWQPGASGHLRYIDAEGSIIYADFVALTDKPLLFVYKGSNWVEGVTPAGSGPVTITVKSGAAIKGVGYVLADTDGDFEAEIYDGLGNPIVIAEGDTIEFAPPQTSAVVPPLAVTVDVAADLVTGKGPANALVNVNVGVGLKLNGYRFTAPTGADGSFALDLRGILDIQSAMTVFVEYRDAAGHEFLISQNAGSHLAGALNTSRVWGWGPAYGTPVQVTVRRNGNVIGFDVATGDTEDGDFTAFVIDAQGQPVLLQAGDIVSADFGGGQSRSLTLAVLALNVDLGGNRLQGTGPAASLLGVEAWLESDTVKETVLTNAGGQWVLDLAAQFKVIEAGDRASVRYAAAEGDLTWLVGVAPIFWLREDSDNSIRGYATPWTPVTIRLLRNGGVLATAYLTMLESASYDVHLLDRNGLAADMQPGDIVEVANAGSSTPVSVTVPPLAATVDEVTRTIIGRGPALADVGLQTEYGAAATVRTDAGGAFQAVFPQSSEIGWVQLAYREPQGNWILAQTGQPLAGPAYLAARWDGVSNRYLAHAVAGNAGVSVQSVAVTLRRNGVVVATGATMAAADGDFTVLLQDAAGNSVDIAAGDVIEMAAGAGTRVLTVPLVTAQVNLASGTLYGVGPAYARLLTGGWYCPLLGPTAAAGAVSGATAGPDEPTVDGGGNWVVACDNLRQGAEGYVAVVDADDNLTYVQWHTPHVTVRLNGNEVEGVAAPEAAVRVELRRGAELIAASEVTADESDGWFEVALRASSGTPANIRANDVVVVQYGGQTITVPVTPITAEVDAAADTISGSGPAGKEMDVYAFGMQFEGMVRTVKVSAGGSYTADFREAFDIVNGVALIVDYVNDDGNTVYLRQNAPLVRINLSSDIVDGYAAPNARATLLLKRAAATVATAAAVTNATGSFSAFFLGADGAVVDLTTGDVVEITTEPFVSMGMVGQPLGALGLTAALDPAFDTVAGMGPAGTPILVVVHRCLAGGCFERAMTAIAGSDGAYVANFAGVLDLDATSYAYVQAADAQGNLTSVATAPGATPRLEEVLGRLAGQGATLIATASGTANRGNLTPPLRVTVVGAGKLVLAASGGNLVVTAPDGKVLEPQSSFLTVANPLNGVWLVQVRLAAPVLINNLAPDDLGIQYTIAVGQGLYSVYMPTVKQQHP